MTDLDHEHCEGKDVGLLSERSAVQHLRGSPYCGSSNLVRVPDRILILCNGGEAKVCDEWVAGLIQEDIRLAERQYRDESGKGTTTYSSDASMDHAARMDIVEALGNVTQLSAGVSVRLTQQNEQYSQVQVGPLRDVP